MAVRVVKALSQAEAAYLAGLVDGEGTITLTHIHKGANRQLSVSIANAQALELLQQIAPYLRTYKRLRAELVIERYKALTPRNGKYSPELLAERERFIAAVLAITPKVALGSNAQVNTGLTSAKPACPQGNGNAEGSEEG